MGISHSVDIDQFLRSNRHIHSEVMDVWGKDTNQDLESDFESSKLKVLLVFLSPLSTRAFSSTYSCISTLMKSVFEKQEECFIDACWYHSREFQDILNSHDIPVMFGNVSHKSWINYDVVCISHAISPECFNVPVIYQKSDFPYSHEERMNNDECPLVFYGGAASISMFPILGGEIPGHGKSFYDVGMLGAGETTIPVVFKILKEFRDKKSIKANKKELLDLLLDTEYTNKYCLYPWLYSFDYEDDNVTIKKINRLDPRIPEKVEIGRVKFPIFKGFNRKMFWPNGLNCDSTDIQISSGCSSYCCSFCSEAQEAGHWTEKPIEQIASDMQESKRYSAANTYSPFSFNSNYYGAYNDMLKLFIDNGSAISLLNQRADVIGSEQGGEYLKLAKKLGLIRASLAIEGVGTRIRNRILNKNLPRDVLVSAMRNIFKQKLIMCKNGMILTGLETDEDIDDFCSELDAILKAREEEGANTALQLKFTPLVYYLQTPLRWQKRIVAENSWKELKTAGRLVEEIRKRGIKQGYNATGIGNWVEQFIIDAGWAGTPILFEYGITYNKDYVAGFPAKLKPMFQELLDKYKIPVSFNWHKYDPDTAIFPIDVVAFTTEKKLSEWKEMDKKNDFYHPICLRTPANPNSKCYNCGACDNADEKKQVFARNISASKHTVVDVLNSLTSSKCASAVRITVKSSPQFDFYSKEMLSHYISSQFLRRDDKLADRFYKVQSNSLSWATQYDQLDYYSGLWSFDLEFKQLVTASQLRPYIDDINSILETCKIVSVVDTSDSLEISVKYFNLYSVNIPLSMSVLNDRVSNFDWQVKIAKKAMQGMELELVDFTDYKKNLLLGLGSSGSVMTMVLPMKFNPYLVVGSIVKKGQDWCYQNLECSIWETGRYLDAVCKCGNPLYYSMTSDKVVSECLLCRSRKVLYKLTH